MIKENLKSFIELSECAFGGWGSRCGRSAKSEDARLVLEGGMVNGWLQGAELAGELADIKAPRGDVISELDGKTLVVKREVRVADILNAEGYASASTLSIALQQREVWKLAIDGGIFDSTLHLDRLDVRDVAVWGGVRKSIFILPATVRDLQVTLEGGCDACLFILPPGQRCVLVTRGSVENTEFGSDSITCSHGRLELCLNEDALGGTVYLEVEGPVRNSVIATA